uniref:Uncharacterized protein n=1 Tax=Anguilla anguilla TaxID=7936 RepID=A0A0E9VNS5_ANGAN
MCKECCIHSVQINYALANWSLQPKASYIAAKLVSACICNFYSKAPFDRESKSEVTST